MNGEPAAYKRLAGRPRGEGGHCQVNAAGHNAYEDQIAAYTLTSSIVYKVTLTSINMIKL